MSARLRNIRKPDHVVPRARLDAVEPRAAAVDDVEALGAAQDVEHVVAIAAGKEVVAAPPLIVSAVAEPATVSLPAASMSSRR